MLAIASFVLPPIILIIISMIKINAHNIKLVFSSKAWPETILVAADFIDSKWSIAITGNIKII